MTRTGTRLVAIVALAGFAAWAVPALAKGPGTAPPPIKVKVPDPPPGFKAKGDVKKGLAVYKKYCLKCHGKRGDGGGLMAKDLKIKPRDLTHPDMAKRTDWALYLAIKQGGKPLGLSDQMTPWKDALTDAEIHDVAAYVRTFAPPGKPQP